MSDTSVVLKDDRLSAAFGMLSLDDVAGNADVFRDQPALPIVVLHGGAPVSLVTAGYLLQYPHQTRLGSVVATLPPPLVVPFDVNLDAIPSSAAFRDFGGEAPGAVIIGGDSVIGIWSGATFTDLFGNIQAVSDSMLPGTVDFAWIDRLCRYTSGETPCEYAMKFVSRPAVMPDCPDPRQLGHHEFAW